MRGDFWSDGPLVNRDDWDHAPGKSLGAGMSAYGKITKFWAGLNFGDRVFVCMSVICGAGTAYALKLLL